MHVGPHSPYNAGEMPLGLEELQDLVRLRKQQLQWWEALRALLWTEEDLVGWLRERLPRLLQEDPRLRAEVLGVRAQTLSPRSELVRVLEEIRALREDFGKRFEAMDERSGCWRRTWTGGSSCRHRSWHDTTGSCGT